MIRSLFLLLGLSLMQPAFSKIISTTPKQGARYVSPAGLILLHFDGDIADKTALAARIEIKVNGSTTFGFHLQKNSNDDILLLQTDAALPLGTSITVHLPASDYNPENFDLTFHVAHHPPQKIKEKPLETPVPLYKNRSAVPANTVSINTAPTDMPLFFKNSGPIGDRYYGMLNNDGSGYITFPDNNQGKNFTLQPSGYLSWFDDIASAFLLADSAFTVIDTFRVVNGYTTDMHEFIHWPDGRALVMAYDQQQIDMSQIVAGGDPNANVIGSIFQVLDPSKNLEYEWRSWDFFPITDSQMNLTNADIDYCHINSVTRDDQGHFMISSRNMDEITLVHKTTGNIIWRLGGSNNMFTLVGDTVITSRQHDAQFTGFGAVVTRISTFDNGSAHPTPISKGKEFQLDTFSMTATLIWEYEHPDGYSANRTGSMQRLDNQNTVINWGYRSGNSSLPNVTEVDINGTPVWQFRFTDAGNYNIYRARRFEWDTLATSINESEYATITAFPNPVRDVLHFEGLPTTLHAYTIYDLGGREIKSGTCGQQLRLDDLISGLYIIVIEGETNRYRIKFLKTNTP